MISLYKNYNRRRCRCQFFWFHCLACFLFNANDVISFIGYTTTFYPRSKCCYYYGGGILCSSSVNLLASVLNNNGHDESQRRLDNDDENPPNKILTDIEFKAWLTTELQDAAPPGHRHSTTYKTTYDNAIIAIVKWRQRYHGNPVVWKRIFKKDRVFKELIESVPVLHSVQKIVNHTNTGSNNKDDIDENDEDNKITILDLCSGKGYLSMFLSEILPPEKVSKIILIDKAWPLCNGDVLPHHMNWEHIYGNIPLSRNTGEGENNIINLTTTTTTTYFETWPIPLHTSKQDLKQSSNPRQMKKHIFDRTSGPIVILAVHLCGTLAIKAVDFFNNHDNVQFFCLKPCCLPGMVHAKRNDIFKIGRHSFPAVDVCSNGRFTKTDWSGPPRWHLEKKFNLWSDHLYKGIDVIATSSDIDNHFSMTNDSERSFIVGDFDKENKNKLGRKTKREVQVQVDGGFQNTYLLAERAPLTADLWD
jgi:hypothetical protein